MARIINSPLHRIFSRKSYDTHSKDTEEKAIQKIDDSNQLGEDHHQAAQARFQMTTHDQFQEHGGWSSIDGLPSNPEHLGTITVSGSHPIDSSVRSSSGAGDARGKLPKPYSTLSLLLIDDDPMDVTFLTEACQQMNPGLALQRIGDVPTAIRHIRSASIHDLPHAVIVDYVMKRAGGITVLQEMGHNPQWRLMPRIVLAGYVDHQVRESCRHAGATDIFVKPSQCAGYLAFAHALTLRLQRSQQPVF